VLGGTLRSGASNVIPPGTVAVRGGTLDLNGFSEVIGPGAVSATGLVMGTYPTDGSAPGESTFVLASPASPLGISTLGTFIQYDATGSPGPAFITGALGLGTTSGTRTIDVGDSPAAATELTITAVISNPGGASGSNPAIAKTGAGRLELSGENTFPRLVVVNAGTLVVVDNAALGATGVGNGTRVASDCSLELRAGVQVGNEPLTLFGLGAGGAGALRCAGGTSTWAGTVDLNFANRIRVESGRLTMPSVTGGSGDRLLVAGDGAGTLALTGLNSIAGVLVEVEAGGRLSVENLSGPVTGSAPVLVDSGGVLQGASPLGGNVAVSVGGRVEPGAPIGILGAGTSNLGVGSLLKLELAGPLPSQYDRFQVANNLTVSGDLEVVLTNGFVPAIGDTFILVTAGSAFPQFQHGTAPPLPPDRAWQFAHLGNKLVARVIAAASVGVDPAAPARTALLGAAPNPFTIETAIGFELSRPGRVDLELFDTRGRRVAVLLQGANLPAGRHRARWSGRDQGGREAGPGIYWARMRVDGAWVEPSRRLVRSP
jgi:autotransporter-associated beta strand protein